ncbi:MAG TPA: hypothetical protein VHT68_22280, partial [Pseudolabrys sp.]|nr:hypothetical protein [Pseudolabrys sp.]
MRLFYGAWPWEASKTWYRTRRAVEYVKALRGERKWDPALRPVRVTIDTSSDCFDRSLVDNPPPEVTPPPEAPAAAEEAVLLQKATEKPPIVRRRWSKSSRRKQAIQPPENPVVVLNTSDSDGGDQSAR